MRSTAIDSLPDVQDDEKTYSSSRVFHTATRLDGDRVLVAGGAKLEVDLGTGKYSLDTAPFSNFLYDGSWKRQGDLNKGRIFHTATKLKSGKVLVVGGFGWIVQQGR